MVFGTLFHEKLKDFSWEIHVFSMENSWFFHGKLMVFPWKTHDLLEDLKEHAFIKDNLIATLPLLEKKFSVSFKVKPKLYNTSNFTSVIHLTIGGDYGYYGYRTPGVWFTNDGSGKMKIVSSVNGNHNYYILTEPLQLNEWSNLIEDLKEHTLINDNLIATLPMLQKAFSVSFKVKPKTYYTGYPISVIHLTIEGDYGTYGDRTPGVWFTNDGLGKLLISSSVNGNHNYYVITEPLQLNEWSSIRISQFQVNEIYMYTVYLNGVNIHSIENIQPQAFTNVNIYAANPWHYVQNGNIKDLRIINGNEETCGLITMLSSSTQNEEIHVHINLTTNCECSLQNISLHLQPDKLLIFKRFLWDDSRLNNSFEVINGKIILVDVAKLPKDLPVWFSAIYGKVPNGRNNASLEGHSKWSYCYGDPVFKFKQLYFNVPNIKRTVKTVKMNPIWSFIQRNQTVLQTEKYQFVCANIQKRQPSLCYQREISTGIITFFSIQLLNVIGYDSVTEVIYGRTHRNNVIEMNINNKKPLIITMERCSKLNACQPFFS
ncbi:uncharacterized protein LOC105848442 [Hydra vulgaris]|uniref:uncharacterized protein LOC105848442 n=1 Tax=Hydra vulgaris TaxID=6087 RepID=UPI0032EA4F41